MKTPASFLNLKIPPLVQMTAWYTLIIMVISVTFSAFMYHQTTVPFRHGFVRSPGMIVGPGSRFAPFFDEEMESLFIKRYDDVTAGIRNQLILVNIAILFGAGLVSYFLAKRTLRPIEDALDEQRRFVADASHELRTPLTAMKTEIEVALKEKDSSEHSRVLKSTLEEVGKLSVLSSSLLQLARHEDERSNVAMEPTELADVLNETYERFRIAAGVKHITLAQHVQRGTVFGDRAGLVQLFSILVDNAIKYSPEHSSVRISGSTKENKLIVKVADEGVGISASDLPHVFRRFYRASASRSKREADGYGLGLSIAKQVVEQYHGSIDISSAVGKGTTVTVALPRSSFSHSGNIQD